MERSQRLLRGFCFAGKKPRSFELFFLTFTRSSTSMISLLRLPRLSRSRHVSLILPNTESGELTAKTSPMCRWFPRPLEGKEQKERRKEQNLWEDGRVHISLQENADELLAQFRVVKTCFLQQPSPYEFVLDGLKSSSPITKSSPTSTTRPPRWLTLQSSRRSGRALDNNGIQNERGRYCWCTVLFSLLLRNCCIIIVAINHLSRKCIYSS